MNRILQIVPTMPPVVDGLGDYAVLLADSLRGRGITSEFLVTDSRWQSGTGSPSATVLTEHSAEILERALAGHQQVLLHFVNYAYEPTRGCPWWLVQGLAAWRRAAPSRRLVVMFHELFAMGWPWRKAFWYSPTQRTITTLLADMADACWTSNGRYANWLVAKLGRAVPAFPVLSNLGEPNDLGPWAERERALIVFGRAVNRRRAYVEMQQDLLAMARTHGLTQVHDVGAPLTSCPVLPGMRVTTHGLLPVAELSHLLRRCRLGIIHNDGSPLAKSGVAAAYAAHGVAILSDDRQTAGDGLVPGYNMLVANQNSSTDLALIAARGQRWYANHNGARLTDHVAQCIAPMAAA